MYAPHQIRDWAARHPVLTRIVFGAQHAVARLEQAIRGKEKMYQEEAILRAKNDAGYRYHEGCSQCMVRGICDGFHGDYADLFGMGEASPITNVPRTNDPLLYIRNQDKVVDKEDEAWAL